MRGCQIIFLRAVSFVLSAGTGCDSGMNQTNLLSGASLILYATVLWDRVSSVVLLTEKTKDNELVECHGEGSAALHPVNSVPAESEGRDGLDVEQARRKSPDEVCVSDATRVTSLEKFLALLSPLKLLQTSLISKLLTETVEFHIDFALVK